MKIIAGVVAAGVLAGAVAVVVGPATGNRQPATTLSSPPAAAAPAAGSQTSGQPAPINEYKGMQEREEVFEFTQKPAVTKEGDKWVITFASKGKCDATVTVVDKDGKIVRHLASGVLGKNAPYPFQQDSLSQKIEWDGLTDDFKKADAAGCKVKVGLGLKAKFERNMAYDPYDVASYRVLLGKSKDGTLYVGSATRTARFVRAYDKDGKYLRSIVPPPAAEVEKMGGKFATTIWGDKVLVPGWFGPFEASGMGDNLGETASKASFSSSLAKYKEECARAKKMNEVQELLNTAEFMRKLPDIEGDVDIASRPAALPPAKNVGNGTLKEKSGRLVADPTREEIYTGGGMVRFNGRTGEIDPAFKDFSAFEHAMGLDGLIYLRTPAYLFRVDHGGKLVPFKKEYTKPVPGEKGGWWSWRPAALKSGPLDGVWLGGTDRTSGCFTMGLYVSSNGLIANSLTERTEEWDKTYGLKRGVNYVAVFDADGKMLSPNVVGEVGNGTGITMDRDGSLYMVYGEKMPAGQDKLDGIADVPARGRTWGGFGILVKYRGLGGKYPLNAGPGVKTSKGDLPGALWAYPLAGHTDRGCLCANFKHDLDRWGRIWVPANQLYSVVVLDANGNRMARIGRYGNVDDTEADLKENKDGVRFVWPRAVAASDTALYVSDFGSLRILKAALTYAAEETVPVP